MLLFYAAFWRYQHFIAGSAQFIGNFVSGPWQQRPLSASEESICLSPVSCCLGEGLRIRQQPSDAKEQNYSRQRMLAS